MIKKTITYYKSGGLKEVAGYVLGAIKRKIYHKSETIFLYVNKADLIVNQPMIDNDIQFKVFTDHAELKKLNFGRLDTLKYDKWLKRKSFVVVGFNKSHPVSFTWTHFGKHEIHNLCTIDLSSNQCWLGPTFVDKSTRGRGMNKKQISCQMNEVPRNVNFFLTSVNSRNLASLKSFERLGFIAGARITKYHGFFSGNKKTSIEYLNGGEKILHIEVLK
jgi:predicted GNAT family acetyltransferase